jgi:hypothetical protein
MPVLFQTYVSGCSGCSGGVQGAAGIPGPSSAGTLSLSYNLTCVGGSILQITESFSAGANGSASWDTTLASASGSLWTAEMGHDYWLGFNSSAPPLGWFPGAGGGEDHYPRAGYSPFSPWELERGPPQTKVAYGSEGGETVTVLGMGTALWPDEDVGVSFVQDPSAFPYLAGLGLCGKGKGKCPTAPLPAPANDSRADLALFFSWLAQGYRLGLATEPVKLSQSLLLTNADWRAGFGWAVDHLPAFFEPHVNMSAVDGPGTYAHLGHAVMNEKGEQVAWDTGYNFTDGMPGNPPIPAEYLELGNTMNWDASFPYQSHGNFIPYNLTSGEPFGDEGWTTCFGAYNCSKPKLVGAENHASGPDPITDCKGGRSEPGGWTAASVGGAAPCWSTSYTQINDVYNMLRSKHGISNCMYGNFWEYGFNVSDLKEELFCDHPETLTEFEKMYCDTNIPLRTTFKHSWLPNWSGKSEHVDRDAMMRNGMDGSIVMDAADPAYHQHLLRMVDVMLEKVPASSGICIDGTASWTKMSPVGDDGRTLCGGKYRCHTQVGTFIETAKDIGDKLHEARSHLLTYHPT